MQDPIRIMKSFARRTGKLMLGLALVPAVSIADEICEYELYSSRVKASVPVCEIPASASQACGSFLLPKDSKQARNAWAISTVQKKIGECASPDKIIGICMLDNTRLLFLAGEDAIDAGFLEVGCGRMGGTWRVLSLAEKRSPELLKALR